MAAATVDVDLDAARTSLASACGEVRAATAADHVDGVRPALVARPGSTEEVAGVLRAAAAAGLTVVPRGRGTKMTWGMPPERADLVIDLGGMDAVLDHAAGDLIVEAQAGAPLAVVQETVAGAGQRLGIDDPVGGSSIGGALATNLSGPRRMTMGSARDLLIGVTLVRADGVVAKAGGRVVKNVAGYDLGKLVIGSFGTLAIVIQAVFRLHPLPAAQRLVAAPFDTPEEAQRRVQQVLHAQVVPAAVEIDWSAEGPGRIEVLLEGIDAAVEQRAAAAAALLGDGAASEGAPAADWGRLPWPAAVDAGAARSTALKITFPLSGLSRVLAAAQTAGSDAGVALHLRGSAGVGVVSAAIPAEAPTAAVAEVVTRLRAECSALGGALVVLDGPREVKATVDPWGPVPAIDLMRRVKAQFDPQRRLAPGRFVGGI